MALITLANLRFAYDRPVLKGISFALADGERAALLGPNGAGKSTLLLHLNGVLQGEGVVTVAGTCLEEATLPRIRGLVGLVFQDPDDQLFCSTLYDDVAYGPRYQGLPATEVDRRTRAALRAVGLEERAEAAPHHLSGGQKKRAALATVLSMEPRLLVLDEPTAGLDARARRQLLDTLAALPQALLVATHDLELARELLPRALVLDEGELVLDAPTEQLLADRPRLERHGLIA